MNNELHKQDVINKISEKLKGEKIVIGGNGNKYKRKYHLCYTQMIIKKVLDAFWEVVVDTIEEGDLISIYGYIKMEPSYYKERILKHQNFSNCDSMYVPPHYKMKFTIGDRLKDACRRLSDRELNNK